MSQPYFYIIRHIPTGKQYAGAKWGKNSDPNTFMKPGGYKTSSKTIHKLGINNFEIVDIILEDEIRMPFGWESVYEYETWFLKSNNIAGDNNWINAHNNTIGAWKSEEYKKAMIKRYGTEEPINSIEIINKMIKNNNIKYGCDWYSQTEDWKIKCREKSIEKYGVDHMLKSPAVINKRKESIRVKYGCENVFQSSLIKEQIKATKLEKYKNENYNNSEQSKITCTEKYGVSNYSKTETHRKSASAKMKITMANLPNKECPYCGFIGKGSNMTRWHFDNCKNKS